MVAQKGRLLLVKRWNGSAYVAVGGSREKTITINNEPVDVTNDDSSGIRTLLEGGGITSHTIKLQGVYVDDASVNALRVDANTNVHNNYQLVVPGTPGRTYQGRFMLATFEESGVHNESVMYSLTLESDGPVTIS